MIQEKGLRRQSRIRGRHKRASRDVRPLNWGYRRQSSSQYDYARPLGFGSPEVEALSFRGNDDYGLRNHESGNFMQAGI